MNILKWNPIRRSVHDAVVFVLVTLLLNVSGLGAEQKQRKVPTAVNLYVAETAGIRRGADPVNARVPFPPGALRDAAHVRLLLEGKEMAAQVSPESKWPDGSIQWLAVDFNASIGPLEELRFQIEYGDDVVVTAAARGLIVTQDAGSIQVSNLRFSKTASPLILSANYRQEFIAPGAGGFVVTDRSGQSRALRNDAPGKIEILKPGPLYVVVRFSGTITIDDNYTVPFAITLEMPNTKSWVKYAASLEDREKRLREISLLTPISFAAFPWLWDFGTGSWSYGTLRKREDSVVLVQKVNTSATNWQIRTGPQGQEQPREIVAGTRPKIAEGWAHFQAGPKVVAVGFDQFGKQPGTYSIAFDGEGLAACRFAPMEPAVRHQLVVYHHYVASPTPVGAGTGPIAMLNPLLSFCALEQYVKSGVPSPANAAARRN